MKISFYATLRTLLEKRSGFCMVAEADSLESAVSLAKETNPDVTILDLGMGYLRGPAMVQQLSAAAPATRIIIGLSLHDEYRFAVEILKAGAFGYLLKDCSFEELVAAIRTVQAHKTYISQSMSGS